MRRLLRYSAVLIITLAVAALVSHGVIVLFIPGFESLAFLPLFTMGLSVPVGATLLLLERTFWPGARG